MLTANEARRTAEQYRAEGFALVRGFIDAEEVERLQAETRLVYEEGLAHHATFRHGNLCFEILPEADFGQRYVIQVHWQAWISAYFEAFRRRPEFFAVLEPILGRDIKQVAQQIHWKPPGANTTGYRFHQDLRFRDQASYDDVAGNSINVGMAIDRSTRENGCLQVIPVSHRMGYLGLSDDGDGQIMKGLTTDDELKAVGINPNNAVHLEMEPGDLALWSLLTVHGSMPNSSAHDRAFAISSYVRADSTDRGEWAFMDGVSQPLGAAPKLCKYDKLFEKPEPFYETTRWWK